MVFVADDLAAWLVGLLADAGRKKLTTLVLGTDQERALRSAATAAVQRTAGEFRPDDEEQAQHVARVISQVFSEPVPGASLAGQETVLEGLQAGIAGQLAALDDASLTGTGQSSADVLELQVTVLTEKLTAHLLREIVSRGSRGGPLFPLASQLNDDVTHLQGQQTQAMLRQLGSEILEALARLDEPRAVAAAPTALAQLPPEVRGFTGRDAELALLVGLLDPAAPSGAVVVSAVAGLAGVGKTTLAVQAGHAALRHGWFGGGVLFIDLHGYDEVPVEPAQALDALLRALGVPAQYIPPGAEERAGLYRSTLAQISDPVLVIADNASSEAQFRALLPGTGPHKVVVTSRHTLAGLDARLVDVTVLDEEAAIRLLDEALRAARPDDDRISGDRQAAGQLARECGGLPLALQIVAALLRADLTISAAELADELAVESDRLEQLQYDDGSGPGAPSVAAAFELSYRRLEETSARVFRLLPVNPGPDVSPAIVAVLADLPVSKARTMLAALTRAHLAEAAPGGAGRRRMHDLLRLYAQRLSDDHADADGREQARDRLLAYYLRLAKAADQHLQALPGMAVPGEFTGQDGALAWLDAERPDLVATITMAARTDRNRAACDLSLNLGHYFYRRRRFDDWLATLDVSRTAARQIPDRKKEGESLTQLGWVLTERRRFDEALIACQDAAAIFRETGDRHEEGAALTNLGHALRGEDRFEEAINAYQAAADIYRETGDQRGLGIVATNLGLAQGSALRLGQAIIAHQDAVTIFQAIGDRHEEGAALTNLGHALREMGRPDKAITACEEAVQAYRDTGDRHGEGSALDHLGMALQEVGQFEEAVADQEKAAAIFRETGDRHGEGITLNNVGRALGKLERFNEAISGYEKAAAIFRETADPYSEGIALGRLGLALQEVGQFEDAIAAHQQNLAICQKTGDRHGEAEVLNNLGMALQQAGRFEEAATAHQDAARHFPGDR